MVSIFLFNFNHDISYYIDSIFVLEIIKYVMYTTADNATAMISLNKAEHSTSIYTTFVVSNTRILPTTAYKILFLISSTSKKRFYLEL